MLGAEMSETLNLRAMRISFGELDDVGVIFFVHREDEVKFFKIPEAELACGSGDLVAARSNSLRHPRVWSISGVVADRSCGITMDPVREAGLLDEVAEDVFSCGGAADISHADKKNVGVFHGWEFKGNVLLLTARSSLGIDQVCKRVF